jgi:hypothetical protein
MRRGGCSDYWAIHVQTPLTCKETRKRQDFEQIYNAERRFCEKSLIHHCVVQLVSGHTWMKSQSLATLRAQMNQRLPAILDGPVIRPFLARRCASKSVAHGKIAIISAVNKISAGRLTG